MEKSQPVPPETESVAAEVVDAAFKVHNTLGPGLLESVYEVCLCYELEQRGIPHKVQASFPVKYKGVRLESGLRVDLLADNSVIVEIKAVEKMNSLFEAQVLTYLKLTGLRLGLLINFNVPLIKHGIKRIVL